MKAILIRNYIWIIFLALLSMASLAGEIINSRFIMSDLEVYYKTADRLVQGQELYRAAEEDPYEHYVYKYSPPGALLFVPFLLVPFTYARVIYWIILTIMMGHAIFLLKREIKGSSPAGRWVNLSIVLSIAVAGTHFFRELHLGQVNLLLLWAYILSLVAFLHRKSMVFGLIIALTIFIKPFGLIFIPLILIRRRFTDFFYIMGFLMVFFILPLLFYMDLESYLNLYSSWFREMGLELSNKQDLLASGNHTLFSVLARYMPWGALPAQGSAKIIYQAALLAVIAGLLLWFIIKKRGEGNDLRIFIILISMIPLLAVTSYNAFIFALPLTLYLLLHFRKLKLFFKILVIFSCLLIGGNIYDLVGRDLFDLFWSNSVYTWGTIGILIAAFMNWNSFGASAKTSE